MRSVRRRRFGQHFLTDEGVLDRMLDLVRPAPGDRILEIGPGEGVLTERLLASLESRPEFDSGAGASRLLAIEIDRDLAAGLRRRLAGVELIVDDVLRVDLAKYCAGARWRFMGNLPYNISTPLLIRLLPLADQMLDAHFLLQREVAARLVAAPGTVARGRLSVAMQRCFAVTPLFDVAPQSFSPPPRVWSTLVRLQPLSAPCSLSDPGCFDTVLRLAFAARRKRLGNGLARMRLDWTQLSVDPGLRPERLTVAQFAELANAVAAQARRAAADGV